MPTTFRPYPETMFNVMYQTYDEDKYRMDFSMDSLVERQPIQYARNQLIEKAVLWGYDYLWFVDDDNPPNNDVLQKLLEADKSIVSAVVPLRYGDGDNDILNIFVETETWASINVTDLREFDEQVIKVHNAGTGCILVRRDALQDLYRKTKWHCCNFERWNYVWNKKTEKAELYVDQDKQDWREHTYVADWDGNINKIGKNVSEDLVMFETLKGLWHEIYCDITATCYHFEWKPRKRTISTRPNLPIE